MLMPWPSTALMSCRAALHIGLPAAMFTWNGLALCVGGLPVWKYNGLLWCLGREPADLLMFPTVAGSGFDYSVCKVDIMDGYAHVMAYYCYCDANLRWLATILFFWTCAMHVPSSASGPKSSLAAGPAGGPSSFAFVLYQVLIFSA